MKKTYVLDTNVLLSDPNSIYSFDEHDVIIPLVVLEELDRHKNRPDDVGKNARQVCRSLDKIRMNGSLFNGVVLRQAKSGSLLPPTLRVASFGGDIVDKVPAGLEVTKVDNLIIAFMLSFLSITPHAVLVSKDINVRIKCDGLGIKCEDYRKMRVASDQRMFYHGVRVVNVDDVIINRVFANGGVPLVQVAEQGNPNEIFVLKSNSGNKASAITRYDADSNTIVPIKQIESVYGLKPRNKEQSFSLDLLLNPKISLITLVGPSGTGKTLLALSAALEQLKSLGPASSARYDKFIVTRPVQTVGRDIGYLPGDLNEKMEPWIAPIKDNLNFLMGNKRSEGRSKKNEESYLSMMQNHGFIEIEAIPYIRGRSIPNSFIVIDEAQNLSIHELKTIITRVGDGTKIVLTGDIEQIDNVHVDAYTNGLTYAVEKFKDHSIAGHVTLLKGERSRLATLASQIL